MSYFKRDQLLHETLREGREYEAFRDAMFQSGLVALRKKRRETTGRLHWALAASILFGIGLGMWGLTGKSKSPEVTSAKPLDSFVSRPLAAREVVHSTLDRRVLFQTEKLQPALEVVTTESIPLIELNDRELLAAFENKPAGFVQNNGHREFMVLGH